MSDTVIKYHGSITKGSIEADAVHNLIILCDDEFKPRLSVRSSTSEPLSKQEQIRDINIGIPSADIEPYFNIVLQQKNIMAIVNGAIVAFMSFKHDFDKPHCFPAVGVGTVNYITTICVHPDVRRRGIATQLYDYIENSLPSDVGANCVATRTWNTNMKHIDLLKKRGYKLSYTIREDRKDEDGTMLDSVYYCKCMV